MENLFTYGTLQMQQIQREIFGRLLTGTKDTLIGYAQGEIAITDTQVIADLGISNYPVLQHTGKSEHRIDGVIYQITPEELQQADIYEGEMYKRVHVTFASGTQAWVYVDVGD